MIDTHTLKLLKDILSKHLVPSYKTFIFGSRTQLNHRKFSDLDIGIMGSPKIPASTLVKIQSDLSDSNIPYITDVVDFSTVSDTFRNKALSNIINL
jgi:predicted nucleotidyltransferase